MRLLWRQAMRGMRAGLGMVIAGVALAIPARGGDLTNNPAPPRPEYRLYAPYFGRPHVFTPEDTVNLARAFDFLMGQLPDKATLEQARRLNPKLRFIAHVNVATAGAAVAEKRWRRQLLFTPCARLAADLSAGAGSFKLETFEGQGRVALKASTIPGELSRNTRQFVAWIRVENELMRVESFNLENNTIIVTRAFDGLSSQSHRRQAIVFSPVYGMSPGGPREWDQPQPMQYVFDPAFPARWTRLFEEMVEAGASGADGVWIDVFGEHGWREADLNGRELRSPAEGQSPGWNFAANRFYTLAELRRNNETGIRSTQEKFRAQKGRRMAVYGQSLSPANFSVYQGLLQPDGGEPPLLEGLCIEDFMGNYNLDEWLLWMRAREVSAPKKAAYPSKSPNRNWAENVRLLMRSAQSGLPAMPFIINAGPRAAIFEPLTPAVRHQWELWAYASYLLGVEKTNGVCPTALGIPLFSQPSGSRAVRVDPMYFWKLGAPAETRAPDKLEKYQVPGTTVFQRRFAHGLVLVNPAMERQSVKFGQAYQDPEDGQCVREVMLEGQSGKILLLSEVQ